MLRFFRILAFLKNFMKLNDLIHTQVDSIYASLIYAYT